MRSSRIEGAGPPFVLAVDIGSSAVKAGVYDALARPVHATQTRVAHSARTASDGTAEEPAEDIAVAVEQAIDAALRLVAGPVPGVHAVGLDSMASTFLGLDSAGRPATPVYMYSDTRSGPDVEQLRREIDEGAVYERTGCPQHTSYLPGRVRWLRRTQPGLEGRISCWADVPTWLQRRWSGRRDAPCSHSIASWSGLLDRHTLQWDAGLLNHLALDAARLPGLTSYMTPLAGLTSEYARRWPALKDARFFPGVGDGFAANIGAGCVSPRRVALTVGTTSAMRAVVPGTPARVPPGLWAYRQGPACSLLGGAFSEGGNVLAWARDTLRLPPLAECEAALEKLPPAGHGLTVLPFLAGERATGWSTTASGVVEGLRVSTTPLEILQACLEAVALRFGLVSALLLPELGGRPEVVASGGAMQASRYWLQTMADVLQLPVAVPAESQDTCRGAAALALHGLGEWPALDHVEVEIVGACEPNPGRAAVYQDAAARQRELYEQVVGKPRFG